MVPRIIVALLISGLIFLPAMAGAQNEVFPGSYLVNAPSGEVLEKGVWEVRISHRFRSPAKDGFDHFFGLDDGGASVLIGFDKGVSDNLTLSLSKTNYPGYRLELQLKHRIRKPLLGTVLASTNWNYKKSISEKKAYSFVFQGVVPLRFMERFSALLVPSYLLSFEPDEDDIASLGLGLSYDVFETVSLMIEWFPVLSGDAREFSTWSVGIGKHIGWHDFALVFTNSTGISASDYLRGGNLDIGEREFRLGFNIFRRL